MLDAVGTDSGRTPLNRFLHYFLLQQIAYGPYEWIRVSEAR
jgi:hypothetical protein